MRPTPSALTVPLLVAVLLASCAPLSRQPTCDEAGAIGGDLVRVEPLHARLLCVRPDVDFATYTAIQLLPLDLDSVRIIQPQPSYAVPGHRRWALTDADRHQLQRDFHERAEQQLSQDGGPPLAAEPGAHVLRIEPLLARIAPNAPRDDFRSRPTGRGMILTEGAGRMDLTVTFSDAITGEVLALAQYTYSEKTLWGVNTAVSNMAEVRRGFNRWGSQIRAHLQHLQNLPAKE